MKKSLLEILEAEKKAVSDERFYAESAEEFINHMKEEEYNAESCKKISEEYEAKRKEALSTIASIRKELREYVSFLEKMI